MKKQFFRVKQLADQTFSRAGKTEALSDDLQDAERRVEFIRSICQNAGKKIANPGGAGHDSASREKRLKKNTEFCLGISMLESASSEDDHLLRQVVTDCGKLQMCLANAIVDHEMKIETNVVAPLLGVFETDYPNIMKVKRNLSKLILDMDSARARYQQAMKHGGTGGAGSKVDSIRDELEEAETKVEQCRDNLACEMLQLISRESELSLTILEYARLQKTYHQAAVAFLDEIIPDMERAIDESDVRPVFGRPLEEHLRVTGRKIAYPIELCVCGLLELGIAEEGLFRVAPGASKLRRMKLSLDASCLDFESALQFRDPHVFAGVLKSYLRELPDPLLTHQLYEKWMAAARIVAVGNQDDGLNAMWKVLHSLPQANFDNLHYLVKFLASLASNKHSNKMNPQNIAIVIAPNLIWSPNDDSNNIGQNMTTANLHSVLVDCLVSFTDWFFPGEIEFYVTLSKDTSSVLNGHGVIDGSQLEQSQEMKRTHSNDSLSDHNSPPQGSPKPAIRSRKHKPAAPNPPGMQTKEDGKHNSSDKASNRESRDFSKSQEKTKEKCIKEKGDEKEREKKEVKQNKEANKGVDKATSPRQVVKHVDSSTSSTSKESPRQVVKQVDSTSSTSKESPRQVVKQVDSTSSTSKESPKNEKSSNKEESTKKEDNKTDTTEKSKDMGTKDLKEKEKEFDRKNSEVNLEFSQYDARRASSGDLNRRTSKSGEDVRKMKVEDGGGFCTLRKPPRPMPRTILGENEKPAIPERPPQLQRPPSFRMAKSPDSTEERNISLERTHMYSVDKQQVAIIQVNTDKVPNEKNPGGEVSSVEKPEKPKKPESLIIQHGHHRAASEGSIIDTGVSSRPPRPTPPPPPVLTSPKKESTDL